MHIDKYKLLMDTLASLASVIAIITVLISWYRSTQKPLRIEGVIIYPDKADTIYVLLLKNRKNYPVEIKSIECYTRRIYNINIKPILKYSKQLIGSDKLSNHSEEIVISANGYKDIKMVGIRSDREFNKLFFAMNTSHGYHGLWCKNIEFEEFYKCDIYDPEDNFEYESIFKANTRYYYEKIKIFIVYLYHRIKR